MVMHMNVNGQRLSSSTLIHPQAMKAMSGALEVMASVNFGANIQIDTYLFITNQSWAIIISTAVS